MTKKIARRNLKNALFAFIDLLGFSALVGDPAAVGDHVLGVVSHRLGIEPGAVAGSSKVRPTGKPEPTAGLFGIVGIRHGARPEEIVPTAVWFLGRDEVLGSRGQPTYFVLGPTGFKVLQVPPEREVGRARSTPSIS